MMDPSIYVAFATEVLKGLNLQFESLPAAEQQAVAVWRIKLHDRIAALPGFNAIAIPILPPTA
jgi:hypothetical protein